jgi:hypothetical protein
MGFYRHQSGFYELLLVLTITTAIGARAGTLIRAWAGGGIRAETIAGTVTHSVAVTTAATAAIAITVTALTTAAVTIAVAALTTVATAISAAAAVAASISTTAAISAVATSISATAAAAAGQNDPGLDGTIGSRVQIRGEAFTGVHRVDGTGCCAPGRYGCQK